MAMEIEAPLRTTGGDGRTTPAYPPDERRQSVVGSCVKKTCERHAVRKMKEDPSEPSCRGRLQTAMSCFGSTAAVVNVMVKRRDLDYVMCGLERRAQVNL